MSGATRVSLIPITNANRPGRKLRGGKPRKITIHETANTNIGADAEMHRRFVHNPATVVSFHYVVDEDESIQLLPDNEVGWHAGDGATGPGNNESVAIETCVNSDGDWNRTLDNLVKLTKHLMAEFNLSVQDVVQHNKWSGKNCPTRLRANNNAGWNAFIARLQPPPDPTSDVKLQNHFVQNGANRNAGALLKPTHKRILEDGQEWDTRVYERWMIHTKPGQPVFEGRLGFYWLEAIGEL